MASPTLALAQSPPPKSPAVSVSQRNPHCWSKLPLDLMQLVFERLAFLDFERAKSVCSSWQFGSKQSKPNNQIPWMILFPTDKNYCLLFNPEDKEKLYKTQHLGDDFAKSIVLATYRSWLLMQPRYEELEDQTLDQEFHLYIKDLLTCERINLPAFESDIFGLSHPILWIDDKTKDYLVIGTINRETMVSFKNGDNSWKKFPELPKSSCTDMCLNMIYKDHKLHYLDYSNLYIYDFFGEFPREAFRISVREFVGYATNPYGYDEFPEVPLKLKLNRYIYNMIVTVRGDVLIVASLHFSMAETWEFIICKMDSSKVNKWEEIVSLGDESILLGLGITVLAKDMEGITCNSIYFTADDFYEDYEENEIFIYNLDTNKVEIPHQFVSSSIPSAHARWFLPTFKRD
ncbi:F-box protein (DUF295) [Arabidopsis thaliana]|uniref:F-box protein At1g69090 n=1 Tax=Arabidopsis thaliana TaxID=3702 RepID=FB80_ARATH|nr:F-box protein (DUF295) [Arabidopsis thaliana]Q9LQB0.2 RecName: Full=F-box protein At1g69090 [Arabidopsis thaliana]AEE34885.1 F-box protein (DUF295) [Arabidopsis thaliana]|eukprot:NP_177072.1 F-box protein (DUF295) [Arabidopsis thaliana]